MSWTRAGLLGLVVLLSALAAAGCGGVSDQALDDSLAAMTVTPGSPGTGSTTPSAGCRNPTASLRPSSAHPVPGHMPAGTFMRRIQDRGRLVAGVDQNTLLFGYLDPLTGRLQGFEVDLLRQIAKAIFGDANKIELRVAVTSDQRLDYAKDGTADVVADAITVTCDRLQEVAFSTVYYDASQRVLVPTNSTARNVNDLRGKRVCARANTTTMDNIEKLPSHPIPYPVEQRTDCLVALQEGNVDAISADDSILRGFQEQDPYTKLLPGSLEPEPYGMAISRSHPDFVRFVNGVLARMRSDGTWAAIYRKWLGTKPPPPPHATYRD